MALSSPRLPAGRTGNLASKNQKKIGQQPWSQLHFSYDTSSLFVYAYCFVALFMPFSLTSTIFIRSTNCVMVFYGRVKHNQLYRGIIPVFADGNVNFIFEAM